MSEAQQLSEAHHLDRIAHTLAGRHTATVVHQGQPELLAHLEQFETVLQQAHHYWSDAAGHDELLPLAAEWLLDNYYVVRQALRQIEDDLPVGYYRELPIIAGTRTPRIYAVASALLAEGALRESGELEVDFLCAYQEITPLTMGELWAVPIMLRYRLVEQLAYAAARLTTQTGILPAHAEDVLLVGHEAAAVDDDERAADAIVRLRQVNNVDWQRFFENVSLVHQTLCQDPAGVYSQMTNGSRNRYRGEIELLARYCRHAEHEIATRLVDLAQTGAQEPGGSNTGVVRTRHVGYYLVGRGRPLFEAELQCRFTGSQRLRRWVYAHPTLVYLGGIGITTLLLVGLAVGIALAVDSRWWQVLLVVGLGLIPALMVAVTWVNWLLTQYLPPRKLPKLLLDEGVPIDASSMVVIPALINRPEDVDDLLGQLEVHYQRNLDPQGNVLFGLLTDFGDAAEEHLPGDDDLLAYARDALAALNAKYPQQPFYLFHRKRLWNPAEGVWMGWERKRGKLHEFNRLLRLPGLTSGTAHPPLDDTSFIVAEGDLARLPLIRYVITLDADTVLPRDAARRLIGTLAHPLNQAEFDPATGRVVAGYTVLQPRTEINATSANRSIFTQVFAGEAGIDLYTLAVSDIYQDLFGAGIYVGKGIYDVDAFERSLDGRVPENALLSHDLFEGIQGRAGLANDILLFEDYPPNYLVKVRRSHRWVRGDWQLLPWLGTRVPAAQGTIPNPLSLIDRWKIFDNLMRSLLAPMLLLWFAAAWTVLPGPAWVWTLLGVLVPGFPALTSLLSTLLNSVGNPQGLTAVRRLWKDLVRWLLQLAFLPYEAVIDAHAILVTLYRLLVTRRHLLEWTTAAHTARLLGEHVSVETMLQQMLPSIYVLIPILVVTVWFRPEASLVAAPLWLLWGLAAPISYQLNRPTNPPAYVPTPTEEAELRKLARRTWLFYEQYVGPEDHWLPPDHFQESPKGVVAHRTSPTNIGLYLLSVLGAHDLGYVSTVNLMLRLRSAFDSLNEIEQYRGHLVNWFDTRDFSTLLPAYVSTVDSGNLAAALIALKEGCLALPHQPLLRPELWQGLLDALSIFEETVNQVADAATSDDLSADEGMPTAAEARATLLDEIHHWQAAFAVAPATPRAGLALLTRFTQEARPRLDHALIAFVETHGFGLDSERLHTLRTYAAMIPRQLTNIQYEFDLLGPWPALIDQPPHLLTRADLPAQVVEAWTLVQQSLPDQPTLAQAAASVSIQEHLRQLGRALAEAGAGEQGEFAEAQQWCQEMAQQLAHAQTMAQELVTSLTTLAEDAVEMVAKMDFAFLYDTRRQLFHIGYNITAGHFDANYYDLLASEARLASLVAIAKREIPQRHWLKLGRPFTTIGDRHVLLSWSGTMFEYLMPLLLTRSYPGTLLDDSCHTVVEVQRRYGERHGVPWGISESGFYQFDSAMNYQYRAFGTPRLGLKRGLEEDLVIAPYASMMAVGLAPDAVLRNLDRLQAEGIQGRYGLYEAVDYTQPRLREGEERGVVRAYMAHHQGMILLALANYLQGDRMVERFHADPTIQGVDLLLQEQIPAAAPPDALARAQAPALAPRQTPLSSTQPWTVPVETAAPQVHLLANGRFTTVISNSGGGYSHWQETALTRWRSDPTLDDWGLWVYLQDVATGDLWSIGRQPTGRYVEREEVIFFPHQVEFRHRRGALGVQMTVMVAPDADVEIRRVTLTNTGDEPQQLRLTTYGEVILGDGAADLRHPAFAKLFVESEYLPEINALCFRRRPRSATEAPRSLVHALVGASGRRTGAHESDRARFLGRGRTARNPQALEGPEWLSGTTGATLDPVMALGEEIEIAPHATVELAILTAAGESQAEVLKLVERYQHWHAIVLAFTAARNQADRRLPEQGLSAADVELFGQLLSHLIYPTAAGRAAPEVLAANRLGQSGLWSFGISGDYPILLVQVDDVEQSTVLRQLILAHTYWRRRGIQIDLVIVNEEETNYGQNVQGAIFRLLQRMDAEQALNQRGGIFILRRDQMNPDQYTLVLTVARVLLHAGRATLETQLEAMTQHPAHLPALVTTQVPDPAAAPLPPVAKPQDLHFDNGWGGFSPDGREYVIYLEGKFDPAAATPAPWINVIANAEFGFLASESGGGYSWAVNSGENRVTEWRNDPVTDMPAEALYLRDEETGQVWSPTPLPAPTGAPYLVRHGAGYTTYEHHAVGVAQRVRLFAAVDAPVKFIQVRLRNHADRPRRLTVTFYAEWVLGVNRVFTSPTLVPEFAGESRALLAVHPYNAEFAQRCAFVATDKLVHGYTTDRTEFLGRAGSYQTPAALQRIGLTNAAHAGVDSCAALQVHVNLPVDGEEELLFVLGEGNDRGHAEELIAQLCHADAAETAYHAAIAQWDTILGTVQVETPDPAMDLLLNRWLLYQALSCRIWGRSALYQSSGAYGFRDQLQDVMALIHARPDLVREQIVRAAHHQFAEGDVLHWWHPPSGRGVRTRITDDLLWLPYVTAHYVAATGDRSVLDEEAPFLTGAPLPPEEAEHYGEYAPGTVTGTIYEHCCRALAKGTTRGRHGLPLMGGGDWNDGMNRVGIEGQGESIWLGWFLYATQNLFADLAEQVDRAEDAARLRQDATRLQAALEEHGWDGAWYRRAYYDDGTPLGSAQNQECRIDSIAQSWSVLSGGGDPARTRQAMDAVRQHLVKQDARLILLFAPPFDRTPRDPGYIKGYLPGVRENGGQYTHGAMWTIWAWTQLGEGNVAHALFRMVNPIERAAKPDQVAVYKVEPYVISADVYGVPPHEGRGGWTWYTGSSGWMYRLGVEAMLGLRRDAEAIWLDPCIPREWPGFKLSVRWGRAVYHFAVENPDGIMRGVAETRLDGNVLADGRVPLHDDGREHTVTVRMGQGQQSAPASVDVSADRRQ